ncbi:MAG TPA: ribonuclease J [Caldisericia bacterium]|nr:ribonuclease J [Caldisericia bacterium]HPC56414.1 ribonuclease J [Caldisericia bacterium]HRT36901.1 ribonuclease J [Caldisericia bacterium]HRU73545.1 ribonuclease J [Caldisericia bacterium]
MNSKNSYDEKYVKITFLGGLNEIGKNMMVFEDESSAFILDSGFKFPESDMFGVEYVIPNLSYIEKIKDKLLGIVISHGHLDHIGSLKYVFEKKKLPIYGTKLTLGLCTTVIPGKFKPYDEIEIKPNEKFKIGNFTIEGIYVNHSIPDGLGFVIENPNSGKIFHTGDFKIDTTPIDGKSIDLQKIATIGNEGILLILSDSTNATKDGFAGSEKIVGDNLINIFKRVKKRAIITTFSTNIHRIQQIFDISSKLGKKVYVDGKSFVNIISIAKKLGYINIPDELMIDINDIPLIPEDKLVILTTGSQGEPLSGLTRLAYSNHEKLRILPGDTVIISAHPIPGNEEFINRIINNLFSLNADVIYREEDGVHVSGHAAKEELKIILQLVKPQYFIPIHGETRHIYSHKKLANEIGIAESRIIVVENGDAVFVYKNTVKRAKKETSGDLFIDGLGLESEESEVIKDRRILAKEGIVTVGILIKNGKIKNIKIISRGFFNENDLNGLIDKAKERIEEIYLSNHRYDKVILERDISGALSSFFYEKTRRKPIIIPLIFEENE